MVVLGIGGSIMACRYRLEARFVVGNLLLAVIGFGSFAFHATLLFETQMADEVPILYLILVLVYMEYNLTDTKYWW